MPRAQTVVDSRARRQLHRGNVAAAVALVMLTVGVFAQGMNPATASVPASTPAPSLPQSPAPAAPLPGPSNGVEPSPTSAAPIVTPRDSSASADPSATPMPSSKPVATAVPTAQTSPQPLVTPSSPAPAQKPAGPPTEIVADRTRDSRTFDLHNGSYQTQSGHNLNYQASPGDWEPVDLGFAPTAGGFVESGSDVRVMVSSPAVEATAAGTGKGIRWLTSVPARVSGTFATTVLNGSSWAYVPTAVGLEFSTVVTARRGPTIYTFPYQLLGGEAPFTVAAGGSLTSDTFNISRATIVEANGHITTAGGWQLLPGNIAAFSFDDASLPASAFPYVVDPSQTLTDGIYLGESFSSSSSSYPVPNTAGGTAGTAWLAAADDLASGQYGVADQVMTFNTAIIPANAIATYSGLDIATCWQVNQNAGWYVQGSWVTGALSPSVMFPPQTSPNALINLPYPQYFTNPANPTGCIQGTAFGNDNVITLNNNLGTEFNSTGMTELQWWIANRAAYPSSTPPTADNFVYWAGYANGANAGPVLTITWHTPPPAPGLSSAAPAHSLTPTFSISRVSDSDGDPVSYAYFVNSSSGSLWSAGWTPATSVQIPAGYLQWNQSYTWSACSWDLVDPPASIQCAAWQSFSPVNHAPPTPTLASPADGANLATYYPSLVANPVTDPDGDPVSYHFKVTTTVNGSTSVVADSGWISSAAWTVPNLLPDATYSWSVQAEDNYQATSGWAAWRSFFVDVPPPAPNVTYTVPAPAGYVTSTTVSLTWSDTDPAGIAGYSYVSTTLDQSPVATPTASSPTTATSVTVTAGGDGLWYFHIRAVNGAGVWGPTTNFPVYVSGTSPPKCTTQPLPSTCTPSSDAAGLENFYPYSRFPLGNGNAYANMATGNLIVQNNDLSVPGQGLNLVLTRTYNANRDSIDGPLGRGWQLGVEAGNTGSNTANGSLALLGAGMTNASTMGASDEFAFTDADGTTHYFAKNAQGSWVSPPGVDLTLTQAATPGSPWPTYFLTRPDGVYYEFQIVGTTNYELTQIANRAHTASLCYNYVPVSAQFPPCSSATATQNLIQQLLAISNSVITPQLQSVTDENGRSLSFTWSGNYLSEADFQAAPGGLVEKTNYTVTGGRLVSVTQATGTTVFGNSTARTVSYGYAPTGGSFGLTGVTDTVVNPGLATTLTSTQFAYSPTQTVVASPATPALAQVVDRAGQPWSLTYGGASCLAPVAGNPICLTDPQANTQVWTSNATLNLVNLRDAGDVDANGHPRLNQTMYAWGTGPTANLLVSQTDASGNQTSYSYNGLDQITQTVRAGVGVAPLTTNLRYQPSLASYQAAGDTPAISDLVETDVGAGTPQVRTSAFVVNADGTLASETSPGANAGPVTTRFSYYPGSGLLTSITDPDNNTTTYGYVTGTAANDYGYDVSGQPLEITDAAGHPETIAYDYLGNQTTLTDRAGATSRKFFDPFGKLVESISPLQETTYTCFDADGNPVVSVSPLAPASVIGTNPCALVGADGYSTRTSHDARDAVSSTVTEVDGHLSKRTDLYYPNGSLQGIIEPRSYDASGNLLPAAQVAQVTATYYPDQRMANATDQLGATSTATYTPIGQIATQSAPPHDATGDRTTTTYAYNGWGVISTVVSGISGASTSAYDLFGEVTATTTPANNTTLTSYWPSGAVQTTTAPNQTTSTTNYDPAGNISSLVQPTGAGQHTTVTYTDTALNQIRTETDPADAAHQIVYGYDNDGRQTGRIDLSNGVTETTQAAAYDADGRQISTSASSTLPGVSPFATTAGYDAVGDVTSTSSTLSGAAVSTITTAYSPGGLPKVMNETLTTAGTVHTAITKQSISAYNNDSTLAARGFDGVTTTYSYLLNGAEATTTDPSSSTAFTSTYFPSGDLKTHALPNAAVQTQAYDPAGRLASQVANTSSGSTLTSYTQLGYDPESNLVTQTVTQQTAVPLASLGITSPQNIVNANTYTGLESLGYDANARLTSFQGPVDAAKTGYGLDDAGNVTATAGTVFNYLANRLTSSLAGGTTTSYGYDHVGNQTTATVGTQVATSTAYDAGFHTAGTTLNAAPGSPSVAYEYDALGRLAARSDSSGIQLYFHQGSGATIAEEVDAVAGVPTTVIRYILDSSGSPLGQATSASGLSSTTTYDVADPRGDVVQVLDASANVLNTYGYDPFGNTKSMQTSKTTAAGPNGSKLQFQGAQVDPTTGNYELGPRLYNPQINRFVGADLYAASAAGLTTQADPLTGNRYLYAGANPAGLIDNGYGPCLFFGRHHKVHGRDVGCLFGNPFGILGGGSSQGLASPSRPHPSAAAPLLPQSEALVPPSPGSFLRPPYDQFYPYVHAASQKYGIPEALVFAIIEQESNGVPDRISFDGTGYGLMQIDSGTSAHAKWLQTHDWRDPAANIDEGTAILKESLSYFPGNLQAGIDTYNAGPGNVQRALLAGKNPDSASYSGTYGRDVLAYERTFQAQLYPRPLAQ